MHILTPGSIFFYPYLRLLLKYVKNPLAWVIVLCCRFWSWKEFVTDIIIIYKWDISPYSKGNLLWESALFTMIQADPNKSCGNSQLIMLPSGALYGYIVLVAYWKEGLTLLKVIKSLVQRCSKRGSETWSNENKIYMDVTMHHHTWVICGRQFDTQFD